jgi:hypothetical protein
MEDSWLDKTTLKTAHQFRLLEFFADLVRGHAEPNGCDWQRIASPTTLRNREDSRPRCAVQNRRVSQICRLERVAGCGIIGVWRKSSAHLHRPWRAKPIFTKLHPLLPTVATDVTMSGVVDSRIQSRRRKIDANDHPAAARSSIRDKNPLRIGELLAL